MRDFRAAFIVWNPFQMLQFSNLAERYASSKIVLIDRGDNMAPFGAGLVANPPANLEIVKKVDLPLVDGCYEAVFFQSPFPGMESFGKSKLVSLQYGLAKERHNYGEWRALADLNLMYGPYSAAMTEHFAPSAAVGNVKFAGWDFAAQKASRQSIEKEMKLRPGLPNILFMPTYGELGSFAALVGELGKLADQYNIIVKMHHNNDVREKSWQQVAKENGLRHLYDGGADQLRLLAVADLVISDFSGAIFDAVYGEVPVLLYQEKAQESVGIQKFELGSIEFRRRDDIGLVCDDVEAFPKTVRDAIADGPRLVEKARAIRSELFVDGRSNDTLALIDEQLALLIDGKIPELTKAQRVVRETVQALRKSDLTIRRLQDRPKKRKMFGLIG